MTFRGLLNCEADYRSPWFDNSLTRGGMGTIDQQIFVTLFKFLSGSAGQSLGIRLRAHNYGRNNDLNFNWGWRSGGSSSMDYWDEAAPAGNNAFGVFEFTNSTPPLWICLQFHGYSFNSSLNPSSFPTNPTYPQSAVGPNGNESGVFISCAFRQDGGNPFGSASMPNNGTDIKPTPVWNSGSVIFPRASGDGGDREAAADGVMRLTPRAGSVRGQVGGSDSTFAANPSASYDKNSGIYHVIASEDSLLFVMDPKGIGNYSCVFYVGKYDQIRTALSESLNWCNYVCLQLMNTDSSPSRPILPRYGESIVGSIRAFGERAISTTAFASSGSSVNPDHGLNETWIGGGANNTYTNRVEACIIDRNQLIEDTNLLTPIYLRHPNRAVSDPTGRTPGKFDMFTVPIACFGDHFGYGKLGEISTFYMVFGLPSNATINNKQWAVVGDAQVNSIKLAIPWDGVSDPGTAGGRGGIAF